MNNEQRDEIARLRREGCGYGYIAKHLGINENTVKSYCRRYGLKKEDLEAPRSIQDELKELTVRNCLNCGTQFIRYPGRREKKFCCDRCRNKWWNAHIADVKRKAMYDFVCPTCGKVFYAYGNKNRKYCGHPCYIKARFGE